jgi:hypothetical protein
MIPIVFFAIAGFIADDFDGFVTLGITLLLLAILYLVKLSRSIEAESSIFGNRTVLRIFILFFLTLCFFILFYKAEQPNSNSEITTMGGCSMADIATCCHFTFGPNVTSAEGRVIGGIIIMIVGIGITCASISTPASRLTQSRTSTFSEEDPKKDITDKIG